MRILVTRPASEAQETVQLLAAQGIAALATPLVEIEWFDTVLPAVEKFQAILFTSRNGVRAFARHHATTDKPVFCVGDRTAEAAFAAGYKNVFSADGDAAALAEFVTKNLRPDAGALLRVAPQMHRADLLTDTLRQNGFAVEPAILYRNIYAPALPDAVKDAIAAQTLDGVLFFSPGMAANFTNLIYSAGLSMACRHMKAWCISEATARALDTSLWQDIQTAARPTQESLLQIVLHARNTER